NEWAAFTVVVTALATSQCRIRSCSILRGSRSRIWSCCAAAMMIMKLPCPGRGRTPGGGGCRRDARLRDDTQDQGLRAGWVPVVWVLALAVPPHEIACSYSLMLAMRATPAARLLSAATCRVSPVFQGFDLWQRSPVNARSALPVCRMLAEA